MDNFTAIPNELFESDFWKESKLSHQAAFIDLFRMRRNSPSVIEVKGQPVTIETDQAFVGLRKLSERWGVSINTARRYLKIFEKTRLIKLQKTKLGTKINFLCFTRGVSKSDTQTNTQTNTRTNTIQNVKMNKMNKKAVFKKNRMGLRIAYCSKCGKQHFPDDWQLKQRSSCCTANWSVKPIVSKPINKTNDLIENLSEFENGEAPTKAGDLLRMVEKNAFKS